MPYKKQYRKRKRYNRRGAPFSKKQVKAIQKIAQHSGEMKNNSDNQTSSSLISTSPFIHRMSHITIDQGDGEGQRVGDEIFIKQLSWRCLVDAGTAQGILRVIVIQQLSDTLDSFSTGLLVNSFLPDKATTNGRYKVLYDKLMYVGGDVKNSQLIKLNFRNNRLPIKKVHFDEGLATYSGGGDIEFYVITDNTTASQITCNANLKLMYYDS